MRSTDGPDGSVDPRSELRELAGAVRALVEWHEDSGSDALPVDGDPAELLRGFERKPPQRRAGGGAARPPAAAAAAAAPPAFPMPAFAGQPPSPPAVRAAPARAAFVAPPPIADAPIVVGAERRTKLEVIAETVKGCTRCGLHAGRKNTVFARGNPDAELCFVGEGPGADEDAQGLPFVGKAGQLLDRMIGAMGLRQDEIYIANIVKCRPPNNRTPEPAEMASCLPYLNEQLDLIRPRAIVALGSTALRGLLGPTEGITKIRGKWKLYRGSIPLMPTFHPAYVLRTPTKEVRGMVWSDLQLVLEQLGRPVPARGA